MGTNRVFLRGMVHEDITNTVIVKGQKQEHLQLEIISMSLPEKVEVALHRKKEEGSYVVSFKNLLKDEGFYAGEVRLLTNYVDEPEIKIQILGAIQPLVVARPKVLTFGSMPEKDLTQMRQSGSFVATRQVMVYLAKGNNLKIKKVELEKSFFTVSTKELQPGKRYQLLLKPILEKLTKGQNNDLLRIHTNQEHNEMLEIPVHFHILE
ncbi:MAG: hypothetical protein JW883_06440 [Deltaproteobacteria bacterium]|nr:hypothetical protein [Deltaproteobacteria bacterium]